MSSSAEDRSHASLRELTPSLYSRVTRIEQYFAERYFEKFMKMGTVWYRRTGEEVRGERGLAQLAYKYATFAMVRLSFPIAISGGVLIGLGSPSPWIWGPGVGLLALDALYGIAIARRFRAVRTYFELGTPSPGPEVH